MQVLRLSCYRLNVNRLSLQLICFWQNLTSSLNEMRARKACKVKSKSIMHIYRLLKSNIWMSCIERDQKHMEYIFFKLHHGPLKLRGKSLAWSIWELQVSEHLKHQQMFPRQKVLWLTFPYSHFPPSGTGKGGRK